MLGVVFVASTNVTCVKCYLIAHIKLVIHALICPIGHVQEQCFQVYTNLCLHVLFCYTFLFYNICMFSERDLDCGGEELVVADCRGFVHHHHPRQCHRPSHCRIVGKKQDPGILDPELFLAQIRKVEARLGKLAKIRKVETG